MVCDSCKIGLSFNSECFHCHEHWTDRFIRNVMKSKVKDIEKTLRFELECLEEEVLENFKENE